MRVCSMKDPGIKERAVLRKGTPDLREGDLRVPFRHRLIFVLFYIYQNPVHYVRIHPYPVLQTCLRVLPNLSSQNSLEILL